MHKQGKKIQCKIGNSYEQREGKGVCGNAERGQSRVHSDQLNLAKRRIWTPPKQGIKV